MGVKETHFTNLAKHDAETYPTVDVVMIDGDAYPLCPVCNCVMVPASPRRNNNKWDCPNEQRTQTGKPLCSFIEGKLGSRTRSLWDCRYEPTRMA